MPYYGYGVKRHYFSLVRMNSHLQREFPHSSLFPLGRVSRLFFNSLLSVQRHGARPLSNQPFGFVRKFRGALILHRQVGRISLSCLS